VFSDKQCLTLSTDKCNKPVGELARALPSFKRLLLSVDESNDILSNTTNFTPPTRAALFYAARRKAGWQCLTSWKVRIFVKVRSRQMLLLPEF